MIPENGTGQQELEQEHRHNYHHPSTCSFSQTPKAASMWVTESEEPGL